MTVHFVRDFMSYFLALKHLKRNHTSQILLEELQEIVMAWDLKSKVIAISADGAYNIKKVIMKKFIYNLIWPFL